MQQVHLFYSANHAKVVWELLFQPTTNKIYKLLGLFGGGFGLKEDEEVFGVLGLGVVVVLELGFGLGLELELGAEKGQSRDQ